MGATESKEIELRRAFNPEKASYKAWDDDLIRLVASSVMPPEATNADTYFLLELAGRYGLDPFAREIWAAKMKGKTGEKGGVQILVGRDGLLSIAERHPEYKGNRNHAVYANDEFHYDSEPRKMPDGTYSHVRHSFSVTGDRGELLGAWAEVYRKGRPATFFYAPLSDYLPTSEKKLQYSPWATMKNVMIAKCALATALRIAFRISGLYIEEEMAQAMVPPQNQEYDVASSWPEDEALAKRLSDLFAAAEDAKPGSWLPGKITATLEGCDSTEEYEELASNLEDMIRSTGGTVPEPEPERMEFEKVHVQEGDPEEEIEDAEVVAESSEESRVTPPTPEEVAEAEQIPFGE